MVKKLLKWTKKKRILKIVFTTLSIRNMVRKEFSYEKWWAMHGFHHSTLSSLISSYLFLVIFIFWATALRFPDSTTGNGAATAVVPLILVEGYINQYMMSNQTIDSFSSTSSKRDEKDLLRFSVIVTPSYEWSPLSMLLLWTGYYILFSDNSSNVLSR